jgi:Zn-dependent protease with chaperone function
MTISESGAVSTPPPPSAYTASYESPIRVERRESELPLVIITAFFSLGIWGLLALSIVGLVYAAFIAVFFFVAHVAFVTHVRGSAVRLGPDQFPELYATVQSLARRMGLQPTPEVYLMEAGGTLNALASKFLRSNIVVLFSDLIDACGDDTAARDMIIAHELGHIRAGHLRWTWFLLPGMFIPFLGTALSRSREYTADQYGLAGAGNRLSALTGLAILAAGAKHGPLVNAEALMRQRDSLNTGWMRIGEWLSTHPPLVRRMAALDPALDAVPSSSTAGTVRALAIVGAAVLVPVFLTVAAFTMLLGVVAAEMAKAETLGSPVALEGAEPDTPEALAPYPGTPRARAQAAAIPAVDTAPADGTLSVSAELALLQAQMDAQSLADEVRAHVNEGGTLPLDTDGMYEIYARRQPATKEPRDPFSGQRYLFERALEDWIVRGVGPDKVPYSGDDVVKR